ncbi:serine hydrolase [Halalkalicoccus sp. NIPERK01]|uniref:serine hydrolase domain-containing protein n=1 Tax=Halalkalicoccus sp. NIPERK01 TaxID=3053469 RepID=UPI00256F6468|nr:serine hydrolase domain-containing protein [Halalkalicoccus sp. NIPERK01]MDL5362815.1 serine hydrolase domain-containing protein [Halalkalicoccus sp. NIPERK01]
MDAIERVEAAFETHVEAGLHHGAQLAVYHEGDLAIDLAGGTTGPEGEETTPDRKHVLFSCTKPYAAVALHRCVEDGLLDYDDRVTDHWPGFAEGGEKSEITVRQVLSHQAGLHETAFDAEFERWADWEAAVAAMEEAETTFSPGETAAYHSLSFGFLVGELVRRASGVPIDEFVDERVFAPLGMADTDLGIPEGEPDTTAALVGFEPGERARETGAGLDAFSNAEAAALFGEEWLHRAVVPAASATGTARDMARFYSCLANGGKLDGTTVLAEETVEEMTAEQVAVERDGTLGVPRRYGLGVVLGGGAWDKFGTISPRRVFGHGGLGSIVGWADPDERLAFAYVTNGIREEFEHAMRANALADAVRVAFA